MASQLPSFDVLMDLAQNNPEQLEDIRRSLSEEIIQEASPSIRQKLEGINFKVDMERQRSKNPLQSCIRVAALMHDSFSQMREEIDTLFQPPPPPYLATRPPLADTKNEDLIQEAPRRQSCAHQENSFSSSNVVPFTRSTGHSQR